MIAAEAMSKATSILENHLPETGAKAGKGTVVIGTVAGDIHDIGKNIVSAMLKANGLKVYDLGKDVPSPTFIQRAEETHADVIALSALLSTTMVNQQDVIRTLQDLARRDRYKVIVGGAPVTEEWATQIGADAYGKNANDGVPKIKHLLGMK